MNGSVHRRRDQWQNWDPRSAQGQPLGLKGRKPCHLWQRGWAWRHQANEISQSQKDKCRYCTTPFLRKIENSWAHWPQRRWGGRNGEVLVKGTELWSLGWAHPGDVLCDAGHDRQSCVVCFNISWESSSHVKCSYCKKTLRTKIERNWVKTLGANRWVHSVDCDNECVLSLVQCKLISVSVKDRWARVPDTKAGPPYYFLSLPKSKKREQNPVQRHTASWWPPSCLFSTCSSRRWQLSLLTFPEMQQQAHCPAVSHWLTQTLPGTLALPISWVYLFLKPLRGAYFPRPQAVVSPLEVQCCSP